MAHDVFLVHALDDTEKAKLIARRLRALKFKVRFDAKRADDVFDEKSARDSGRAKATLALWSEAALESEYVRAAASNARAIESQTLVHAGLDKTIPPRPFRSGPRFNLDAMTTRTTPEDWSRLVVALGAAAGRTGLDHWLGLAASDEEGRAAWFKAHPEDPLTIAAKAREPAPAAPPPPSAASRAASIAAAAIKARPDGDRLGATPAAEAAVAAMRRRRSPPPAGLLMVSAAAAAIAGLLILSGLNRSTPLPAAALMSENAASRPASIYTVCPAGQIPRSLLRRAPLSSSGEIVIDE